MYVHMDFYILYWPGPNEQFNWAAKDGKNILEVPFYHKWKNCLCAVESVEKCLCALYCAADFNWKEAQLPFHRTSVKE